MKVPNIKDCVGADKRVRFVELRDENLIYQCQDDGNFTFPVPLDETKGATFRYEDKSVYFMTWIKRQIEYCQHLQKEKHDS